MGHVSVVLDTGDFYDKRLDISDLISKLEEYDYAALTAPLYVDTLPCPVIWLFEALEKQADSDSLLHKGVLKNSRTMQLLCDNCVQ